MLTVSAAPQLKDDVQKFDTLYVSPLTRATQTADIITDGMGLRAVMLPSLREIDLYSFQVRLAAAAAVVAVGAAPPAAAAARAGAQQQGESSSSSFQNEAGLNFKTGNSAALHGYSTMFVRCCVCCRAY
jgi:broad specificity phosphatase PhoE